MPFKKGDKKPAASGRKKGSQNRVLTAVHQRVKELKHDPIRALVEVAQEAQGEGDLPVAVQANKELLNYMYPKLRSIEHQVGNDPGTVLEISMVGLDRSQPIEHQVEQAHTVSSVDLGGRADGPVIPEAKPAAPVDEGKVDQPISQSELDEMQRLLDGID